MSDEEKYVTTLQGGKLAVRTVAQTGEIIDDRPGDKYWTALVQTANGPQECVKTVSLDGGGGGGGTSDYTDLENKPQINSVTLTGNKTGADLGLLSNTATGTDALTIFGTACTVSNGINIGKNSEARNIGCIAVGVSSYAYSNSLAIGTQASASSYTTTAIGCYSQAQSSSSVSVGYSAKVNSSATNSIQLGTGTNATSNTLQVWDHTLLDKTTGKIPTDRMAKIIELTTTSVELASDNVYNGGELASVTLTLPATVPANFCCQVQFTSGATATTFSGTGIYFEGDECAGGTFTPSANHRYSIMIYNDGVNTIGFVYEK